MTISAFGVAQGPVLVFIAAAFVWDGSNPPPIGLAEAPFVAINVACTVVNVCLLRLSGITLGLQNWCGSTN